MVLCEVKFHLVYTASSSTARAKKEEPVSDKTKQSPKLNHSKPGTIDHISMHQHTQAHTGQGPDPLPAMFTQTLYMRPCTQVYSYTQQLCPHTPTSPTYPRTKHLCPYRHRQLCTYQPCSHVYQWFHPMC